MKEDKGNPGDRFSIVYHATVTERSGEISNWLSATVVCPFEKKCHRASFLARPSSLSLETGYLHDYPAAGW